MLVIAPVEASATKETKAQTQEFGELSSPEAVPEAIFAAAQQAFRDKNFALTLKLLSQLNPDELEDANAPIFLEGMALLGLGRSEEAAISFKSLLADNPSLLRVRLELARAFFNAGDDVNAQRQFTLVLAADIPPTVRVNVQRFLDAIRARRLWWVTSSFEFINDLNVNQGTGGTIVYIRGLPFRLSEDTREQSGLGVRLALGGTRIFPYRRGRTWRLEAQTEIRDFSNEDFDTLYTSFYPAHQWSSAQFSFTAGPFYYRRWYQTKRYSDVFGGRFRYTYRLSRKLTFQSSLDALEYEHRRSDALNGPGLNFNSTLVLQSTHDRYSTFGLRASRRRTQSEYLGYDNIALKLGHYRELPLGMSVNLLTEIGESKYQDVHPLFSTTRRDFRYDLRAITNFRRLEFKGFHPSLVLGWTRQDSNHILNDYERPYFSLTTNRRF